MVDMAHMLKDDRTADSRPAAPLSCAGTGRYSMEVLHQLWQKRWRNNCREKLFCQCTPPRPVQKNFSRPLFEGTVVVVQKFRKYLLSHLLGN